MKKTADTDKEVVLLFLSKVDPLKAFIAACKWVRQRFLVYLRCFRRFAPLLARRQRGLPALAILSFPTVENRPIIKLFTIAYYDDAVVLGKSRPCFFQNRQVP